MQKLSSEPTIILDVAHNPHSAEYLVKQVKQRYGDKKLHAVIGMLHDKDVAATLEELKACDPIWYPASLEGPRAASASELSQHLSSDTPEFDNPIDAFNAALSAANKEDVVLVLVSFSLLAQY